MDVTQAALLLTVAASFDNRKPDADAARAWSIALDGIDFDDARAAIIRHFRESTEWLMPAHVITNVKRIERERIAAAPNLYELTPPDRIANLDGEDFDRAYLIWIKEQARRVRRGLPLDVAQPESAVTGRDVRELVAQVTSQHRAS